MNPDLAIINGIIVNPQGMRGGDDIAVVDGKIAAIDRQGSFSGAKEVIDASGLNVLPGLIEIHVNFREPGYECKEDFFTGSTAVACGEITTIFNMPNNLPFFSNEEVSND